MKSGGHIWLLGLSGSGKSTLAPLLAQKLGLAFLDTDEVIVQSAKRPIPEIFSTEGETGFRQREMEVIREIKTHPPTVVACGGGAVLQAENLEIMQQTGVRVYLRTPPELLVERLRHKKDRPLLAQGSLSDTLANQLSQREPRYRESEILVETGMDSPAELAEKIFARLKAKP